MFNNTAWTNDEASKTKLALSKKGYIDDPFVKYFCQNAMKRTPEINRGYFARVYSILHSVKSFCLKGGAEVQIVNIGSGFDTLFWRLVSDTNIKFAKYVDIDSNEIINRKIRAINQNQELLKYCSNVSKSTPTAFISDRYNALAHDATKGISLVKKLIQECNIEKTNPIIFIFECVLLYWNEESTTNLIHTLNSTFKNCNFVIFDLVNTDDRFSYLMQESLVEQNTPLLGAQSFGTLEAWHKKLAEFGCNHVNGWIMNEVYDSLIPENERSRIEKIEFFDEIELLSQLFNHYCLILASNCFDFQWE